MKLTEQNIQASGIELGIEIPDEMERDGVFYEVANLAHRRCLYDVVCDKYRPVPEREPAKEVHFDCNGCKYKETANERCDYCEELIKTPRLQWTPKVQPKKCPSCGQEMDKGET